MDTLKAIYDDFPDHLIDYPATKTIPLWMLGMMY